MQSIVLLVIDVLNNLIIIALGCPIALGRWVDVDKLLNSMFMYPSLHELDFYPWKISVRFDM